MIQHVGSGLLDQLEIDDRRVEAGAGIGVPARVHRNDRHLASAALVDCPTQRLAGRLGSIDADDEAVLLL